MRKYTVQLDIFALFEFIYSTTLLGVGGKRLFSAAKQWNRSSFSPTTPWMALARRSLKMVGCYAFWEKDCWGVTQSSNSQKICSYLIEALWNSKAANWALVLNKRFYSVLFINYYSKLFADLFLSISSNYVTSLQQSVPQEKCSVMLITNDRKLITLIF